MLKKIISLLSQKLKPGDVAAFDADGTLWPRDIGRDFFRYQVQKGFLHTKTPDPKAEFDRVQKEKGRPFALMWLAQVQAGFSLEHIRQWVQPFLQETPFKMFALQKELIGWFQKQNVPVFVVSSSLQWVLEPALKPYNIPPSHIIGVQTKVKRGVITDVPILPAPIHQDKVEAFQKRSGKDSPVFSAGNTLADQALLELAREARLVVATAKEEEKNHPSEQALLKMARDRGWFFAECSDFLP